MSAAKKAPKPRAKLTRKQIAEIEKNAISAISDAFAEVETWIENARVEARLSRQFCRKYVKVMISHLRDGVAGGVDV